MNMERNRAGKETLAYKSLIQRVWEMLY